MKILKNKNRLILILIIVLISLGIVFRCINLEQKVYWLDEFFTSIRSSGFTVGEVNDQIFVDKIINPNQILKFQNIKPKSTSIDTVNALAKEVPQHPPLYFLITRYWVKSFGSSLTAYRSLPIVISLFSLPLIYLLSFKLFNSKVTAIFSVILLSLSPVNILYDQTARQYSLFTLLIITSSLLLLKAIEKPSYKNWVLYSITGVIGLYTHLFFLLTLISQSIFIIFKTILNKQWKAILPKFLSAILSWIILYSPWIIVLINNFENASNSSSWVQGKQTIVYYLKFWMLSFTSLFIDLNFGIDNFVIYLERLLFILLILAAIYTVFIRANQTAKLYILISIFVPFLLLVIPDILFEARRSTITRYLLPCFLGVQLAVAYFFSEILKRSYKVGTIIIALVLTASIISNTKNALSETSWAKGTSYSNNKIVALVNTHSSPLLITDRGNSYLNVGELISLSYFLNDDVKILPLSYPPKPDFLKSVVDNNQSKIFVFRPSNKLSKAIKKLNIKAEFL